MNCPKCDSDMEKVTYEEIEVDRCINCKGIWFDMLEREHLKDIEGSESIDIGSTERGERFNKMTKIDCPACKTLMIEMVDKDQPHISYEACTTCYGLFFDAGEFKDYKHHTVFEFFKKLFVGKK